MTAGPPLLEKLAALEHEQWMFWASALAASEPNISEERRKRWARLMVPYEDLPEQAKEDDRILARKVLKVLREEGVL